MWIQGLRRLNGRLLIHAAEGLFGLGLVDVGALDGHKVGRCSQACDVPPCGLGVVDCKSHSDTQKGRYERNETLSHISTEVLTLECETGLMMGLSARLLWSQSPTALSPRPTSRVRDPHLRILNS